MCDNRQLENSWETRNKTLLAAVMRFAAANVEEGVVPNSCHWVMEENPEATIALGRSFSLMSTAQAARFSISNDLTVYALDGTRTYTIDDKNRDEDDACHQR